MAVISPLREAFTLAHGEAYCLQGIGCEQEDESVAGGPEKDRDAVQLRETQGEHRHWESLSKS